MLRSEERMEGGDGETTVETDHDSLTYHRGPNVSETDLCGGGGMRYGTQSTVSTATLYPTSVVDYGDPCSLLLSLARFPFNCRDLEEGSLEKCLHFLVLYAFSS